MRQVKRRKRINQNAPQREDVVIHGVGVQSRGIGPHCGTEAESGITGDARAGKLPHGGLMVRRSCGSLDRDGAGTDRGGEIIACRGVRTGNRGLRQGRAHALRAAAERRILQTPRQGEEQQDQCQLNSLLHPVRIINFYAAKIHSFTQKSTLANQKDHKMTNFDYKSTNPRPAKNTVSYVGNGIRTPAGTAYFSAYRSPTTFQSTTPQRASTASARRFR